MVNNERESRRFYSISLISRMGPTQRKFSILWPKNVFMFQVAGQWRISLEMLIESLFSFSIAGAAIENWSEREAL